MSSGTLFATLFTSVDTAYSTIEPTDDEDPFVFKGAAGGTFSATVSRGKGSLLEPMLKLLAPDGSEIPIGDVLKLSTKSAKIKKLVLPETGVYSVVVFGVNGTTGDYKLKTKGKSPRKMVEKNKLIQVGEQVDYVFGGTVDGVVKLSVKLRTPDGGMEILEK